MTIYDRLFALANKLAKSRSDMEKYETLEKADFLSNWAKKRIQENLSETSIQKQLDSLKDIDVENDWKKVVQKLPRQKKYQVSNLYKVAAIAILLLSVTYLTYNHLQSPPNVAPLKTYIAPATDKAILTLGDGTQVAMSPETPFKNQDAQTEGDRLEYFKGNSSIHTLYNYLTVPRGGQYQVRLADGTQIWLNADTKIKYPVAFQPGKTRTVELLYGEVYLIVSPSTEHQGAGFKLLAQGQEIDVLGTIFNLKAYNDEEKIYTTLVEGKVQVLAKGKQTELSPGEQAVWDPTTHQLTRDLVEVSQQTAWIRGYFHFRDKPLKDIMQVLARWYDVNISFESPTLEKVKFSGLLSKKQTLEEILTGIKNTKSINAYEIKNKTITIK
ncbi:FecR family protein [Vitellibacter sp. q18]|nr:FecR family protein [Aequorivita lutea]